MTSLRPYVEVTKPKLVSLLVFTAFVGMFVGARWASVSLSLGEWMLGLAAITLGCAGSNAVTCFIDRDIDFLMERTRKRPLPSGRIEPARNALYLGAGLIVASLLLALLRNLLSPVVIGLGVLDNVVVYSLLTKRRSPWNIILGSFSGGLPAVYGWAFATGSVGLVPILMAALVVLWTPNHIWSLALRYREDYARAGVPMLPVVLEERKAIRCIACTSLLLVGFSVALDSLGAFGDAYLWTAAVLGGALIVLNAWLLVRPTAQHAWVVFKFSSPYLAVVFLFMVLGPYLPH
ncbi:MAG TPA: heme o synthase [Thermoplasmata archaeon]|nr:heme o synthase [Thermoplasmata archaeon]